MAHSASETPYLSTHARVLISDWQALQRVIEGYTQLVKASPNPAPASPLLSDRQLGDIFQGPLQDFFKIKFSAYASLTKVRFMVIVTQDEVFKSNNSIYPKEALQKVSQSDLDKIQQTLDTQLATHYEQWQDQIRQWQQQLLFNLTAKNLAFSDIETKEFQDLEPLSELKDRFTDLNIEIPAYKTMDFAEYFKLKTYLVIHSSLSRQHQPHESHEIQKILKQLKKDFAAISNDQKTLQTQQTSETQKTTESISQIAQSI